MLSENLVQSAQELARRLTIQQDNDPKHMAKTKQKWLRDDSVNVLEWPRLEPNQTSLEEPENGCAPMVSNRSDRARGSVGKNGRKFPNPVVQRLLCHTPDSML